MSLISNLLIGDENYQLRDYWLGMCARSNTITAALTANQDLNINSNFGNMISNTPAFSSVDSGIKVNNTSMYIIISNIRCSVASDGNITYSLIRNGTEALMVSRQFIGGNIDTRISVVGMATLQAGDIISARLNCSQNGTYRSCIISMLAMAPIIEPVPIAMNENLILTEYASVFK